jgi:magnesium transporter
LIWHDIRDPNDTKLDELAAQYHLHPLHIEDCRHGRQRAKVEEGADYLFIVLKPTELVNESCDLNITELDLFLGPDYLITVTEGSCAAVTAMFEQFKARNGNGSNRSDQLFYRIIDGLVDTYLPILDTFSELIDGLEDKVIERPEPELLQRIFSTKRSLIELRRVLTNTRDVAGHLQRTETELIQRDLWPFLRDVYDHVARNLDLVEMQRDLLTGSMDIYLSSVANRTNQVMKVLTILGTIALPSLVISGFFGMNTKDLPWTQTPHGTWYPAALMLATTIALLWLLRKLEWL